MKPVDDYLARLPADKRAALERLRAQIQSLAPQATETISYGMPAFRLGERYFAGLGATKQACSLYIGRMPVQACANDLAGYRTWKGTVNFAADRPLPGELVVKLVRYRLAEYEPAGPSRTDVRNQAATSTTPVNGPRSVLQEQGEPR